MVSLEPWGKAKPVGLETLEKILQGLGFRDLGVRV